MTDAPKEPQKKLTEARQREYPKLSEEAQHRIARSLAQSQAADRERAQARREEFIAAILDFCCEHAVEHGSHATDDQHEQTMWLAIQEAFADKWQAVLMADRYNEVVAAIFERPESSDEPSSDRSPTLSDADWDKLIDFVNATSIHQPDRERAREEPRQPKEEEASMQVSEVKTFAAKTLAVLLAIVFVLLLLYVWPGFWRWQFYKQDGFFYKVDRLTHRVYFRHGPDGEWYGH